MRTIEQLQAECAALPKPSRKTQILEAHITARKNAESTVAELTPLIADVTTWHEFIIGARQTCCDELLALPPRDPRAHGLKLSIVQIDRGLDFWNEAFPARIPLDDLMAAAGYQPDGKTLALSCGACWRGSMVYVEERLRDLLRRRDEAQATLDRLLQDEHVS